MKENLQRSKLQSRVASFRDGIIEAPPKRKPGRPRLKFDDLSASTRKKKIDRPKKDRTRAEAAEIPTTTTVVQDSNQTVVLEKMLFHEVKSLRLGLQALELLEAQLAAAQNADLLAGETAPSIMVQSVMRARNMLQREVLLQSQVVESRKQEMKEREHFF